MLDYRPDLDPRTPDMLRLLVDFVPTESGYRTAYAATTHTAHTYSLDADEAFPSVLFASRWLSTPGGIVITGTNKKLNVYSFSNGFINVSKAGDYTLGGSSFQYGEDASAAFDICAFGDRIIATHKSVVPQHRTALDLTSGTLFADLTGAPKANVCAVSRNFVFLGNLGSTWGSTTTVVGAGDMVAWSGIGDYTDWSLNVTVTQSSYAIFNDTPGPITAISEFRDGIVVFKGESMYQGRYVGPGANSPVWDFERISDKVGCLGPRSLTNIDTALVFVGQDDIYLYDGTRPISITRGIRSTLVANNQLTGAGTFAMQVGHDKPNKSVLFSTDVGNTTYVWSYLWDRWGALGNSDWVIHCNTNADDFRAVTMSSVTAGAQSYSTATNHFNLYTLVIGPVSGTARPMNRNTTRSTAGVMRTGVVGDPLKLQTLPRVNPIFITPPASVATASLQLFAGRTLSTSSKGSKTMSSDYRFDLLGLASTDNYFNWQYSCSQDCEIVGFLPTLVPAGSR